MISEPVDIFNRNEFLDPCGASFKLDRNARETVGWRGRSDPPKETFFFDDKRDWFAYLQGCSRKCMCFLFCQHCFALRNMIYMPLFKFLFARTLLLSRACRVTEIGDRGQRFH